MITSLLKGILFVIVMAFYSLCVWRVVNDYFRNEFKSYIEQDPVLRVAAGGLQQPQQQQLQIASLLQPPDTFQRRPGHNHQHNDHSHHQHHPPHPPPEQPAQRDPAFDIFGPGIDHRNPVAFREHIASINRQLEERHRIRPVGVDVVNNKEQLLANLPPDLSDQIQKAVDASFDGGDDNAEPADDAFKYAVMVFDNDLPPTDDEEEDIGEDAISNNEVNVDDGDGDYRMGGGRVAAHGIDEDAFIAVANAMNGSSASTTTTTSAVTTTATSTSTTVGRKIISTLDGDSHQAAAAARKPSIIHANVVSSNWAANHLLVTNDLGDGAEDGGGGFDVDSSGDNELIMAIDGNLIKSLGTAARSSSATADADVDGVVASIAAAAHRRGPIEADDGINALTDDCFCVRDDDDGGGADGD